MDVCNYEQRSVHYQLKLFDLTNLTCETFNAYYTLFLIFYSINSISYTN
jgi:hypothetical protein